MSILKADNAISDELYKLAPTGSRPGILYGLPKVHKPYVSLRPTVSSINSHSFPLVKFLVPLLHPISTNQYTTHDDNEIVMAIVLMLLCFLPIQYTFG